jgi:hypothetical protein
LKTSLISLLALWLWALPFFANFAYSFIAGTSLEDKLKDFVGGDLEDDN